jgi:hypothetical protein
MKKPFILLLIILAPMLSIGQDYHPFPTTNAIWNMKIVWIGWPETAIYRYGILGDTIINNQLYNKLYIIEDDTTLNINKITYGVAIRENNKQIFVKSSDFDFEILLYDFSLNVGDTVVSNSVNGYLSNNLCIITGIDSIKLNNNEYRRRFLINDWGDHEYWIEGIGSIGGIFHPMVQYQGADIPVLRCFKQNDTAVYINNIECQKCFCQLASSIEDNESKNGTFKIYPNPVSSTLFIESDLPPSIITVKLFNANGILIKSNTFNSYPISLNINDLLEGVYLIQLINKDFTYSEKIVKI